MLIRVISLKKYIFPFRFKLTLLVSAITFVLLLGIYFAVHNVLEKEFISSIKKELKQSKQLVNRLMQDRLNLLYSQTNILSGNQIIREILLDKNMDKITADDLIQQEVLANFSDLDTLMVISPDGKLLAAGTLGNELQDHLLNLDETKKSLDGETITTHLFHNNEIIQIFGLPVFLRESLIGVLYTGIRLNERTLKQLQALSDAEIAFFKQQTAFLYTQWTTDKQRTALLSQLTQNLIKQENQLQQINLQGERYLYLYIEDDNQLSPPHLISISLDKKLAFSQLIYQDIVWIGFIGLMIGSVVSFIFARNVSHPIQLLRHQTKEVEKANYSNRVNIQSNDEFYDLGQSFNQMMFGLEERERIRGAMDKVVSKEIATLMLKGDIQLGGEERISSILFSDIRGFTHLSEQLSAPKLLALLNDYFTQTSQCIDQHQGVIDKYIGDAMMALFGVPIDDKLQAFHAVLAAIDMIHSVDIFNQTSEQQIQIGIGINTGKVVAGNIGATNRLNYTVLGNEVNLASRLESLTKHYQADIIISQSTYDAIQKPHQASECVFRFLDQVQVKGQSTGTGIYQVIPLNQTSIDLPDYLSQCSQARDLMMQQYFQPALALFQSLSSLWPEDKVTQGYIERCQYYAQEPHLFNADYVDGTFIQRNK